MIPIAIGWISAFDTYTQPSIARERERESYSYAMDYGLPPLIISSHKHTKMIALVAAIIAVVILAVAVVVTFEKEPVKTATPAGNSLTVAQALISAPNPPSGLSPEEIKSRQAILNH